jgi:hypothetical protein
MADGFRDVMKNGVSFLKKKLLLVVGCLLTFYYLCKE